MTGHVELTRDLFRPEPAPAADREALVRPSLSYWRGAWLRLRRNWAAMAGLGILVVLLALSLVAPLLSPYTYSQQIYTAVGQPPSAVHWLGTDDLGRDLWTRLWMGGRVSLFIGVTAAGLDLVLGALYGGFMGYLGGRVDDLMMRVVELLYGLPHLLLLILLMVVLGPGVGTLILAFALTGWVGMARLVRGQVLQLKEQEFVLAARTMGAPAWWVITRHLLPNAMGPMLVSLTFTVPAAIFMEATLSFLGLGVPMPLASWGTLANDGFGAMRLYPWTLIFPTTTIALTMLAFNLLGDGLRDALDPRLRGRG